MIDHLIDLSCSGYSLFFAFNGSLRKPLYVGLVSAAYFALV